MELVSDRVGILIKYGKVTGSLTKRFFYIDSEGTLYYTEKEHLINEILKSQDFDDGKFVKMMSVPAKTIKLNESSLSGIKTFTDKKFDLQGKSYFEVYLKSRDYRSILTFPLKEEWVKGLREFVASFNVITIEEKEINLHNFQTEMTSNFNTNFSVSRVKNELVRDEHYMERILSKLGGKYINQKGWEKSQIKVINPTRITEDIYEEVWVELENGSNYSGEIKNGMPHGFGKEYRGDGSLYTGQFYEGKWHGQGTITNETLDSYQGEFIEGCICGI